MTYLDRYSNPSLTGVLIKEKVKCGKKNCICNRANLHGPYIYHYFRDFIDGQWLLIKKYVVKSKAPYLRQKIKKVKSRENFYKTQLLENNLTIQKIYEELTRN